MTQIAHRSVRTRMSRMLITRSMLNNLYYCVIILFPKTATKCYINEEHYVKVNIVLAGSSEVGKQRNIKVFGQSSHFLGLCTSLE